MKKFLLIAMVAILAGSCNTKKEEQVNLVPNQDFEVLNASVRNQILTNFLKEKGRFEWNWASDELLYSALVDGNDGILVVGYKTEGYDEKPNVNIQTTDWKQAKENLITEILATYSKYGFDKKRDDIISDINEQHPFFKVKVEMVELVKAIRSAKNFRYAEPDTYYFTPTVANNTNTRVTSGAGCDADETPLISNTDRIQYSDGSYYSWHLKQAGVDEAWRSGADGDGIKLGVIDTGVSSTQYNLNGGFKTGFSTGRNYFRYGRFKPKFSSNYDGIYDDCGHGTSMASIAVGPKIANNKPSGVAYKADFYSVRGTDDVLIDSGDEKDGVMRSVDLLASLRVNIISMSLGQPFTVYRIRDAIRDANAKGIMVVCAAGTVYPGLSNIAAVIFPANMKETVAITGVTDRSSLKTANRCIDGYDVDFSVTMQRDSNKDRMALGLRRSGNSTSKETDYVGGTSAATATFAGMAALVWSVNPNRTKEQVLDIMKRAAERSSQAFFHGWGRVDLARAIR